MATEKKNGLKSMKRRHFLTAAAGVAGAAAIGNAGGAAENGKAASRVEGCDYDVVVIGGGFAGTTAARDSRENGYKTLLVEARNRLGGRTFTADFEGHSIEMGGTWIHWTQPSVWAEVQRYGLEIIETPGFVPDVNIAYLDGETRILTEDEMAGVAGGFKAFMEGSRTTWERPYDVRHTWDRVVEADRISAAEKLASLKLPRLQHVLIEGVIASMAHNMADQMSYAEALRWMSCPGFNDFEIFFDAIGRYKFKDGTISLINAMVEDARPEISLSTVVSRVEDLGDCVRVDTADGRRITAGAVIVTLPMNVVGSVDFTPQLHPKVIEAGRKRHTGQGVKVYARTAAPVGNVMMYGGPADLIANAWTYKEAEDHTILVCFGNEPDKLDIHDERAVEAALARFLPDIKISSVLGYDWNLDPYARGTYCSYKPGWMAEYYDHFQKDTGRIVFGSGDHGEGWRGFIDGAIREGGKAAQRVHRLLEAA